MKNFYIMQKHCWNSDSGRYDGIEKISTGLTLTEVRRHAKCIPRCSAYLWNIIMYEDNHFPIIAGSINASEFEGRVPFIKEFNAMKDRIGIR